MPAPLIIPDHIKHARLALLAAGIAVTEDSPAYSALMCAVVAYNRTPQVSRAVELEQQVAALHRENTQLKKELLREAGHADLLRARLGRGQPVPLAA